MKKIYKYINIILCGKYNSRFIPDLILSQNDLYSFKSTRLNNGGYGVFAISCFLPRQKKTICPLLLDVLNKIDYSPLLCYNIYIFVRLK